MATDAEKVAKYRKMAEDKTLPQDVRNTYLDKANALEKQSYEATKKLAKGGAVKKMAKGGAVAKKKKYADGGAVPGMAPAALPDIGAASAGFAQQRQQQRQQKLEQRQQRLQERAMMRERAAQVRSGVNPYAGGISQQPVQQVSQAYMGPSAAGIAKSMPPPPQGVLGRSTAQAVGAGPANPYAPQVSQAYMGPSTGGLTKTMAKGGDVAKKKYAAGGAVTKKKMSVAAAPKKPAAAKKPAGIAIVIGVGKPKAMAKGGMAKKGKC